MPENSIRFTVNDLINLRQEKEIRMNLRWIYQPLGNDRAIVLPDINRPGLALTGYFENFGENRIQIFGRGETAYLQKLEREKNFSALEQLCRYNIPCMVFTHGLEPPDQFRSLVKQFDIPVLGTLLDTSEFTVRLLRLLNHTFAVRTTIHGVFLEVFGMGVLLCGESGVGKSETALELLERGHRLIADDVVDVRRVSGNILIGSRVHRSLGHYMELRGVGIINVEHLFGAGAIRNEKRMQLVVELAPWKDSQNYDRTGLTTHPYSILDVGVPYLLIPIKPGRNIPILIETGAMNERLKAMGYHAAKELDREMIKLMRSKAKKRTTDNA